jgi:hypothetical protein
VSGILLKAPTLTHLWHTANDRILFATAGELDWAAGATTGRNDNLLLADSMKFDFDVADLWLTRGRFTKLQRDYLDYDLTRAWIEGPCSKQKMPRNLARRGTVTQLTCRVHGSTQHGGKKDNYTWGNCIFGFTFRPVEKRDGRKIVSNQAGIISLHSRTSYVCYMGGMDLALAYVLGKYIAQERGENVEDYGFRWHIDSLQWYSIKSMAYVHTYDLVDEFLNEQQYPSDQYPSAKITRNSYAFLKKRFDNEEPPKYGPTHRVWELMFGLKNRPPSCPVDSLELEAYA